jgi:hypothetical protein
MVEIWDGSEGLEGQSDVGEDGDDMVGAVDAVDAKDSWRRQEDSRSVAYGCLIIMERAFKDGMKVHDEGISSSELEQA